MTNIYSYLKLLLLLASFSLTASSKAQIPAPFPDSSASWNVEFSVSPDPWLPTEYYYYRYYLDGDTLINGQTYTRLYEAPNNAMLIDTANGSYIGALRTDSTQKVWFTGDGPSHYQGYCDFPADTGEWVLYDFNLAVGDTVYPYTSIYQPYRVYSVDTININGMDRRRWAIYKDGCLNCEYWIEGIGSTRGLFFPWCEMFEWDWRLLCFEDKDINYINPEGTNCYIITEVENPQLEALVSIGPNPAAESLRIRIQAPSAERFKLELMDMQGRVLREVIFWGGEERVVNRNGLASGVYAYRLSSPDRGYTAGKLLFD